MDPGDLEQEARKGAQVAGTPVRLVDTGQDICLGNSLLSDFSNPWTGVGANHSTGGGGFCVRVLR